MPVVKLKAPALPEAAAGPPVGGLPAPAEAALAKPERGRMMRQYELVEPVRRYNPNTDENLLNRAYVYAMHAHGLQKRASGEAYFAHPLEVATIAAAVLHDTIEDTEATLEEINRSFGPQIGALVDGLTKIARLDLVSKR